MKTLITLLLMVPALAMAQLIADLPKNANDEIFAERIIEAPGKSASELHNLAQQFVVKRYGAMSIDLNDQANNLVLIRWREKTHNSFSGYNLWFDLKIECRDEKCRASISDILFTESNSLRKIHPSEFFSIKKFYRNDKPRKYNEVLRKNTVDIINEILDATQNALQQHESTW